MHLDVFDNGIKVAEVRVKKGELILNTNGNLDPNKFGLFESVGMRIPLIRNPENVGTYKITDPDYIIGVKIILARNFEVKLSLDGKLPANLFRDIAAKLPPERQRLFVLEILKTILPVLGIGDVSTLTPILKNLEAGSEINYLDLAHLLMFYSPIFADEVNDADTYIEEVLIALFNLIPARPLTALKHLNSVLDSREDIKKKVI